MKGHHHVSHQRWLFSLPWCAPQALKLAPPHLPGRGLSTLLKRQFISFYLPLNRFNDLLLRCRELDTWTQDLSLPAVVWLSGFFNPQSFLTGMAGGKATTADGATLLAEVLPGFTCDNFLPFSASDSNNHFKAGVAMGVL